MKLKYFMVGCVALSLAACGAESEKTEVDLESIEQRLSYMVGDNMAKQFVNDGVALDLTALTAGVNDAITGKDSRLSEEQVQETIVALQERAQKKQAEEQAEQAKIATEVAAKNITEGEEYLKENATKEGVVTTDTGLQYKEITAGDGATPSDTDTVSVHYKGTLLDGTEFDSSYSRNAPAVFPVNGVIAGWTEALQLMKVGDKWELTIPSDLAYGTGGNSGTIGPNAVLVFEVELLEVVDPEKPVDISK